MYIASHDHCSVTDGSHNLSHAWDAACPLLRRRLSARRQAARASTCGVCAGDQPAAAQHIAQEVGIEPGQVWAGVKPAGKAEAVQQLRDRGRCVAMVGDGINDASALATADVGIAMSSGVGAASQVASIVLLGDRLPQVGLSTLTRSRHSMAQMALADLRERSTCC